MPPGTAGACGDVRPSLLRDHAASGRHCRGSFAHSAPSCTAKLRSRGGHSTSAPRILFDATHAAVRQRFTIAHELGHLLLHPPGKKFRDTSYADVTQPQEREANEFASHLLMPLWMLEPIVLSGTKTTASLAHKFNVSVPAMQWQLSKLL